MGGGKRPRRRKLTADEQALWKHVTQSVRKTGDGDLQSLAADNADDDDGAPAPKSPPARKIRRRIVDPPPLPPAPAPVQLSHGTTTGMDRRTAQRLKRGKLDVEGRIDLHGHTQAAAHRALERFLHDGYMAGTRTVLVITGKGDRLGGKPGVLRDAVPRWFNEMPLRQWVAGFSFAAPKDGGDGALYVRLKRRKSPR
ncbi:MAG: Smr/MutS family protein [Rhodospirillales bacterium]|nr:Smr/MutS family protein [Rhodospirillales bacterium]MBO6787613.1 Smr/MutS family protein [Rhodospirillales bacterium]